MKRFFSAIVFCLTSTALFAQDKIETDRPGQSESPFLAPRGWFQAEVGLNKENNEGNDYTVMQPTVLLKYGLLKKLELRLEGTTLSNHTHFISNSKTTTGLLPLEIGAKLFLTEEKGVLPKTAFITQVGLPFISSRPFRTPHLSPSFRFTMQNSLSKTISLDYNVGAEWDGFSTTPSWLYTFAPGFNIGERWYAYVEAFGFITRGERPEHNLNSGIAFLVTKNSRVDLSVGAGLSPDSFKNYIDVGYSFRIPVFNK